MINGLTGNARDSEGSIVAKLHGYIALYYGETEEGLKAQFLALTGETYRNQEEEQAANLEAAKERRQLRIEAQSNTDHQIIADAKTNGFMDCRAIRDALGWDKPNAKGVYHSSLQVAFHWIEEADEEVVYLIPDGITDVTKSERTGCYPDVFARVLAAKEKWDADRAAREKKSWDDAQAAKDAYDKQKADDLVELIARQEAASVQRSVEQSKRYAQIYAARDAEIQRLIAEAEETEEQVIPADRRESIIAALRSYVGPLTRNGLPKRQGLNDMPDSRLMAGKSAIPEV